MKLLRRTKPSQQKDDDSCVSRESSIVSLGESTLNGVLENVGKELNDAKESGQPVDHDLILRATRSAVEMAAAEKKREGSSVHRVRSRGEKETMVDVTNNSNRSFRLSIKVEDHGTPDASSAEPSGIKEEASVSSSMTTSTDTPSDAHSDEADYSVMECPAIKRKAKVGAESLLEEPGTPDTELSEESQPSDSKLLEAPGIEFTLSTFKTIVEDEEDEREEPLELNRTLSEDVSEVSIEVSPVMESSPPRSITSGTGSKSKANRWLSFKKKKSKKKGFETEHVEQNIVGHTIYENELLDEDPHIEDNASTQKELMSDTRAEERAEVNDQTEKSDESEVPEEAPPSKKSRKWLSFKKKSKPLTEKPLESQSPDARTIEKTIPAADQPKSTDVSDREGDGSPSEVANLPDQAEKDLKAGVVEQYPNGVGISEAMEILGDLEEKPSEEKKKVEPDFDDEPVPESSNGSFSVMNSLATAAGTAVKDSEPEGTTATHRKTLSDVSYHANCLDTMELMVMGNEELSRASSAEDKQSTLSKEKIFDMMDNLVLNRTDTNPSLETYSHTSREPQDVTVEDSREQTFADYPGATSEANFLDMVEKITSGVSCTPNGSIKETIEIDAMGSMDAETISTKGESLKDKIVIEEATFEDTGPAPLSAIPENGVESEDSDNDRNTSPNNNASNLERKNIISSEPQATDTEPEARNGPPQESHEIALATFMKNIEAGTISVFKVEDSTSNEKGKDEAQSLEPNLAVPVEEKHNFDIISMADGEENRFPGDESLDVVFDGDTVKVKDSFNTKFMEMNINRSVGQRMRRSFSRSFSKSKRKGWNALASFKKLSRKKKENKEAVAEEKHELETFKPVEDEPRKVRYVVTRRSRRKGRRRVKRRELEDEDEDFDLFDLFVEALFQKLETICASPRSQSQRKQDRRDEDSVSFSPSFVSSQMDSFVKSSESVTRSSCLGIGFDDGSNSLVDKMVEESEEVNLENENDEGDNGTATSSLSGQESVKYDVQVDERTGRPKLLHM